MSDAAEDLEAEIQEAARTIGRIWPLYSFVASNPLAGLEDRPFEEAIPRARALFGGRGYPSARQFKQALAEHRIDRTILENHLSERGFEPSIEHQLERLEAADRPPGGRRLGEAERTLDQILEKWLSSFLDEGRSRWTMPGREEGFYGAWRRLAPLDHQIPRAGELEGLPGDRYEAIERVLAAVPHGDRRRVFRHHLAALPGWVGYIKQRSQRAHDRWSDRYPIDLADYLAVRLVLVDHLGVRVAPGSEELDPGHDPLDDVRRCFLEAWEESHRTELTDRLELESTESGSSRETRPDAQLVFCIDTRSEIIRRRIESAGDYETHGYAGFFGVPMRYRRHGDSTSTDACPPVVEPEHEVTDVPRADRHDEFDRYLTLRTIKQAAKKSLKNIQDSVASAFSYVEFSGLFYGFNMLRRTLFPGSGGELFEGLSGAAPDYYDVTEPSLDGRAPDSKGSAPASGMDLEDRVAYARSAFHLMGWTTFAPVVVFVGHSSDTVNNPFDSSLRCGACSGSTGLPSARVLASICSDPRVRDRLAEVGIRVPDDTVFLAGRHNTTTDRVELLDADVPDRHAARIESLKEDLEVAREEAAAERLESLPNAGGSGPAASIERRADDWAQTRPEWGLAGNASFLVGPNRLRESVDLEGRTFLHSYDWEQDPDGSALEQIVGGPVVVCQWINHQYYFSTVDNRVYGSGSKITHNPVGNFGVLQGNGGALMGGLPLESLMRSDAEFQHAPLRLTTLIHAPYGRGGEVVEANDTVRQLVGNNWIRLEVIDPTRNNERIGCGAQKQDPSGRPSQPAASGTI